MSHSHSQQSTSDNEHNSSNLNMGQLVEDSNQLPPFQSFPARNVHHRSTLGHQVATAVDDVSVHGARHGAVAQEFLTRPRQRTVTLPAFTPFPAASPSSRYAPPEGSRAAPPRPIPTPPLSAELPQHPAESIHYPRLVPIL